MLAESPLAALLDPAVRPVAIGTAALGAVTGAMGTFAVVRRQSLQGDAISHAALPGVALAYLSGGQSDLSLVLGAAVTGWVAMALVSVIVRRSRVPYDAALGGALSVFFGLGLALLTYIQKHIPGAGTLRPHQFLFGQDAALMRVEDLVPVLVLGSGVIGIVLVLWKELKLVSFDPDFAASLGLPTRRLDLALSGLLVLAVVIGLQTVGVVLMSALIVAPASAARQWVNRLSRVTILAASLGALAGLTGTYLSHALSTVRQTVPTGPTIVLVATLFAVVSLLLAPGRGLIWDWVRRRRFRSTPDAGVPS